LTPLTRHVVVVFLEVLLLGLSLVALLGLDWLPSSHTVFGKETKRTEEYLQTKTKTQRWDNLDRSIEFQKTWFASLKVFTNFINIIYYYFKPSTKHNTDELSLPFQHKNEILQFSTNLNKQKATQWSVRWCVKLLSSIFTLFEKL
jgi:hypothetical protein